MPKSLGNKRRSKVEIGPDQIEQVERLAGLGLTQMQIGRILGFSERTLRKRMAADEELKSAYKRGRAHATAYVASKLWEKIEEGHWPPGPTPW
jgi:hypothetical protein